MDNKFVLSPSFNEVVFEKRNKKYGAYDIRRKYSRYALLAGVSAILFFTCGSLTWAFVQQPDEDRYLVREVDLSQQVVPPVTDVIKPVEPIKQKQEQVSTNPSELGPKTAEITSDLKITDDPGDVPPSNIDAGKDPNGVVGGTGSGEHKDSLPAIGTGNPVIPTVTIREWTPYPPTCPELDVYLQKNIVYPQMCRDMGIEGTVYVQFIVDTKGDYRDVEVVKGPNAALNAEALRVMSKMPKWTPAKDEDGTLVDYIMRKPIRFTLK